MSEILYRYPENKTIKPNANLRWLSKEESQLFNHHLSLCGQNPLPQEIWDRVYEEGTVYCILFDGDIPAARACVEKYAEDKWEVSDVRTIRTYRNKGYAYQVSLFVLNFILANDKIATIRTEEDNFAMQRVIEKLGFVPYDA